MRKNIFMANTEVVFVSMILDIGDACLKSISRTVWEVIENLQASPTSRLLNQG